ncbi:MAG: SagB/ThcOx family dehydrogenase, partial [Candidatus Acidiferrales bacterium]
MARQQGLYFRRAAHLVLYWQDGRLVFENYATRRATEADSLACMILSFFDRWRRAKELERHMDDYTPASLSASIRQLTHHGLLEHAARRPRGRRVSRLASWDDWNPAAGFFHFTTKDVQFLTDAAEEERHFRARSRRMRVPLPVKHYPRVAQIALPAALRAGEFPSVLLARRTWRRFSKQAVTMEQLGTLLGLTGGVQQWLDVPPLGRLALKTSPSGGARHPVELYVLALRVAGLPRGIYHYAADRHRLERLRHGASEREAVRWLAGQHWFGGAAALVLMTAVM